MKTMLMRWMTVMVLALALSLAVLELSAGLAAEHHGAGDAGVMNVGEPGLPSGDEADAPAPASPRFTH